MNTTSWYHELPAPLTCLMSLFFLFFWWMLHLAFYHGELKQTVWNMVNHQYWRQTKKGVLFSTICCWSKHHNGKGKYKKKQQRQRKTMQVYLENCRFWERERGGEWKVKLWFFSIYFHNPKWGKSGLCISLTLYSSFSHHPHHHLRHTYIPTYIHIHPPFTLPFHIQHTLTFVHISV